MAKTSLPVFLTLTLVSAFVIAYSAAPVKGFGGGSLGGRTKVEDVERDKEVQEMGEYAVDEYNQQQHLMGSVVIGRGDLEFRQVVEAEKQVVSGIKYYLKIEAANSVGATKKFDAEVVVQPWKESKHLLNFGPSPLNK